MGQNREPKPTHTYMQTHYNVALALQMRSEFQMKCRLKCEINFWKRIFLYPQGQEGYLKTYETG